MLELDIPEMEMVMVMPLVVVDQVLLQLLVDLVELTEMMEEMDNQQEHVVVAVEEVLVVQELMEQMELMAELELKLHQHLETLIQ